MLPEDRSISDGQLQCHLSNGTLALPTSEEENEYLLSIVKPFEGLCAPTNVRKLWLGATDAEEEGVWRRDGDGAPMEYNKFYPPAPNGGVVGNCLVMRSDGAWEDDICDERNKKCTACFYRVSDYLRLRGLCFDNSHQRRFQVVGYLWGKLMYRGFYSLLIYRDPTNTWVTTPRQPHRRHPRLRHAQALPARAPPLDPPADHLRPSRGRGGRAEPLAMPRRPVHVPERRVHRPQPPLQPHDGLPRRERRGGLQLRPPAEGLPEAPHAHPPGDEGRPASHAPPRRLQVQRHRRDQDDSHHRVLAVADVAGPQTHLQEPARREQEGHHLQGRHGQNMDP
ncbi:putative pulmonary surfactant-associated protein A-like [Penaeus vannamei]|uniref:Putative pulmonary surfactant-associated protein A-like n=1 Tax=Penaeus vannamei TaxID=6689 RepID=A0A3R7QCQ6_PENVA|nr:putative pulmonary surfactant-associated protein A-like [Penaeus vannamei]